MDLVEDLIEKYTEKIYDIEGNIEVYKKLYQEAKEKNDFCERVINAQAINISKIWLKCYQQILIDLLEKEPTKWS